MGTPILSSLRDLLTASGTPIQDLPDPERTPLLDALQSIQALLAASASPIHRNDGRPARGIQYLRTLETAYTGPAAADHPRRGLR